MAPNQMQRVFVEIQVVQRTLYIVMHLRMSVLLVHPAQTLMVQQKTADRVNVVTLIVHMLRDSTVMVLLVVVHPAQSPTAPAQMPGPVYAATLTVQMNFAILQLGVVRVVRIF